MGLAGTPVICSRVGGMPEFVRHGETGYIFDTPGGIDRTSPPLWPAIRAWPTRWAPRARRVIDDEFDLKVAEAAGCWRSIEA